MSVQYMHAEVERIGGINLLVGVHAIDRGWETWQKKLEEDGRMKMLKAEKKDGGRCLMIACTYEFIECLSPTYCALQLNFFVPYEVFSEIFFLSSSK
jgi:hypothetical protein